MLIYLIFLLVFFIAFIITSGICMYLGEKREWNNGYCKHSGAPWQYFDRDSQGGLGYEDGKGTVLWLSWFNPNKKIWKK